jgi:hypothetical protein
MAEYSNRKVVGIVNVLPVLNPSDGLTIVFVRCVTPLVRRSGVTGLAVEFQGCCQNFDVQDIDFFTLDEVMQRLKQ